MRHNLGAHVLQFVASLSTWIQGLRVILDVVSDVHDVHCFECHPAYYSRVPESRTSSCSRSQSMRPWF
jgi:hypothetical protein